MKAVYNLFSIFALSLFAFACDDIIESPLDENNVLLISPLENYRYETNNITFWWEKVKGAKQYRIHVVEGDFNNVISLIVDTVTTSLKYPYSLRPGEFQWRVRAENASSFTPYSVRNLSIDSSEFLTQKVQILSPVGNTFFGRNVLIKWVALSDAASYTIQIDTITGAFQNPILEQTVPNTGVQEVSFLHNLNRISGSFKCRVKAINNISEPSMFSDIGSFVISPDPPVLQAPGHRTLVPSLPAGLTWNPLPDAKQFYLHASVNKTGVIPDFPKTINSTNFDFNDGIKGDTIYWKVNAVDIAGNLSDTSSTFYFIIGG